MGGSILELRISLYSISFRTFETRYNDDSYPQYNNLALDIYTIEKRCKRLLLTRTLCINSVIAIIPSRYRYKVSIQYGWFHS